MTSGGLGDLLARPHLPRLEDRPGEFDVEYAQKMSAVVTPGELDMNPYHIGWHIWKDIYRRWETPSKYDRDNWGRRGGEGAQKLFEVRDTEHDASFLANYLTDELIRELKLFRYQWVAESDAESLYRVTDVPDREGFEAIRQAAVMQAAGNRFPMLRVMDANYYHDRTLMIEHVHDGRDLKIVEPELTLRDLRTILKEKRGLRGEAMVADAGEVLKHIWTIWKNPVVLRTIYDGRRCWSAATGTGKRAWNCSIDSQEQPGLDLEMLGELLDMRLAQSPPAGQDRRPQRAVAQQPSQVRGVHAVLGQERLQGVQRSKLRIIHGESLGFIGFNEGRYCLQIVFLVGVQREAGQAVDHFRGVGQIKVIVNRPRRQHGHKSAVGRGEMPKVIRRCRLRHSTSFHLCLLYTSHRQNARGGFADFGPPGRKKGANNRSCGGVGRVKQVAAPGRHVGGGVGVIDTYQMSFSHVSSSTAVHLAEIVLAAESCYAAERTVEFAVCTTFPASTAAAWCESGGADREALRHKGGFVILEDVPIGVCEKCGARYFDASILRRVAEIGRGTAPPLRTVEVPIDRYAPA